MPLFAAVALLLWAGCSDVLAPSTRNETGLRITISNGTTGARTLYPNAPVFSKYILHFEGPGTQPNITLTAGQNSTTVSLVAGTWIVTATGYVMINGTEYAAAEGSEQVTVTTGLFQGIGITIRASQNGANGLFSYSVSFPHARVNEARLYVYPFGVNEWDLSDEDVFDLWQTPSGNVALAPGYYMMSIRLYTDYQIAVRREIVHIYSHMETSAEYIFTDEDFTDYITLSGTANVTVDGQVSDETFVIAYLNDDLGSFRQIDAAWVYDSDDTWSMQIAAFDTYTPVYFMVQAAADNYANGLLKKTGLSVPVKDEDISDIEITLDISSIILSGTVDVRMYGKVPDDTILLVFTDADYSGFAIGFAWVNQNDNNTWSMRIPSFDTNTTVYFAVEACLYGMGGEYEFKQINRIETVRNQNVSNIDLGRVDFTVDIDIANAIPLTADIWKDGNIPARYGVDWYSINVTAGTTYYIYWEYKSWSGTVATFDSNGNLITSGDWYSASFTADQSGTVYIRVYAGDKAGAYAIMYSTTPRSNVDVQMPSAFDANNFLQLGFGYVDYNNVYAYVYYYNYNHYQHDYPEMTYTWFINGIQQNVYDADIFLPTSELSVGTHYGLVIVTIDGTAFAKEFAFQVHQ